MPAISPAKTVLEPVEINSFHNNFEVSQSVYFSINDLSFDKLLGYDTVNLRDGIFINEVGKPMIPSKEIKVALPYDMRVTDVEVVKSTSIEISGKYKIFPTQNNIRISDNNKLEFVQPDIYTYNSFNSYPSEPIEFIHQTDLAGQGIAVIRLNPLQYIPASEKLFIYTSINFVIKGLNGYDYGDFLPRQTSLNDRNYFDSKIKEMVINPQDVKINSNKNSAQTLNLKSDEYDYVIITQDSWVDDFEPLTNWKTKKGVPANIVTISWIYNQYSGTNQQKIRSFIIDAYNDWGTLYFLLGGDTDTIPFQTIYIMGYEIPSDTYYSDFDNDWTVEVNVGRAPVRSTSQIDTFIDKILTYEKNPPLTNYAKNAFFCGFDLYSSGSGEGEGCKQFIKDNYLPSDWTYRQEYDSEAGTHKSDVIGYLNQGNNLVNHADHSYTNSMGVGSTNHGDSLSNSDMSSLNNGDFQSILYTMGCYACNYEDYECIGEAFIKNYNGGGLAFIGNSRYGWYNPYFYNTLSFQYDIYFFRSLFDQNHYILGDCFTDHKNDGSIGDDYYKYVFTELTLLGDPELPIWMNNPNQIDGVTYPSTISTGSQTLSITVKDGGSAIVGARLCIQKEDDGIYDYKYTDSTGRATFSINPTSIGTLEVTVTKKDCIPIEKTITVDDDAIPTKSIFLIGLISNILNHQDYITCNAKMVFYIQMDNFKINIYDSNEELYLKKDYQGYIGSGIIIGLFKGNIN